MIIMLIAAVFLVVAVLLQHGKSHGLSGTIAGGAENFFGKEKGKRVDRVLSRLTSWIGVFFVVTVLAIYVIQPDYTLTYTTDNQLPWSVVSPWYNTQTEIGADEEKDEAKEEGDENNGRESGDEQGK